MTGSPAAFSKAEHLRTSGEFRFVLTKGKSIRENGIALYYVKTSPERVNRLGVLVSKRAAKRAVDRNRIKRAAREYFRIAKSKFHEKFDIVIRAISYDKSLGKKELRDILNRLFERAGFAG